MVVPIAAPRTLVGCCSYDRTSANTLTPARAACRSVGCFLMPIAVAAVDAVVAAASCWLPCMLCMVSTAVVVLTARLANICLTRARSAILHAHPSAARSRLLATNFLLTASPASLHRRSAASFFASRWSTSRP